MKINRAYKVELNRHTRMEKYFYWVSYTYQTNYGIVMGACCVERVTPIFYETDINDILEAIQSEITDDIQAMYIQGWQLLRKERVQNNKEELPHIHQHSKPKKFADIVEAYYRQILRRKKKMTKPEMLLSLFIITDVLIFIIIGCWIIKKNKDRNTKK